MTTRRLTAALLLGLVASACSSDGRTLRDPVFPLPATTTTTLPAEEIVLPSMRLVAPWPDGGELPARHTCDDADVSPALSWVDVPPDAVELALTVTEPVAGGEVFWVVYGISPATTGLVEGEVPAEAYVWPNSAGVTGWTGPCPPEGSAAVFQFTLHALNQQLEVADDASATEVIAQLAATAIDQSSVSGSYARDT